MNYYFNHLYNLYIYNIILKSFPMNQKNREYSKEHFSSFFKNINKVNSI